MLRNELQEAGNWLLVDLVGRPPNTDAIGALVTVRAGGLTMTRDVRSGTSYLSQDDMRPHFGLGDAERADFVEVLWPDGTTTRLENVEPNRQIRVEQPSASGTR